ncbi:unnamed protein product [Sphagnum balticum]
MIKYLSLHYELTVARKLAQEEIKRGPRLAIVGGDNSGASSASKLLLNYAGKAEWDPEETARQISESPVLYACRIHRINEDEITL